MTSHAEAYLAEARRALEGIDPAAAERLAETLAGVRDAGGRVFVLGAGGGAAMASHAVNDLRKLCAIEAYAPSDNAAELTARVNDEGWPGAYAAWLEVSRLGPKDGLLVFSVGGGDADRNVSPNLVRALELARARGARICGVVGRDGGFTRAVADACVLVPVVSPDRVTPHTEGLQGVVWHLLACHPRLQAAPARWEGLAPPARGGGG